MLVGTLNTAHSLTHSLTPDRCHNRPINQALISLALVCAYVSSFLGFYGRIFVSWWVFCTSQEKLAGRSSPKCPIIRPGRSLNPTRFNYWYYILAVERRLCVESFIVGVVRLLLENTFACHVD